VLHNTCNVFLVVKCHYFSACILNFWLNAIWPGEDKKLVRCYVVCALNETSTYRYIVDEEAKTGWRFWGWRTAIGTQRISWLIAVVFRVDFWRAFRQSCNKKRRLTTTSTLWGLRLNSLMQRNLTRSNQHSEANVTQWNYWHEMPVHNAAASPLEVVSDMNEQLPFFPLCALLG